MKYINYYYYWLGLELNYLDVYLDTPYLSTAMAVIESVDTNTETELIEVKRRQNAVDSPYCHQLEQNALYIENVVTNEKQIDFLLLFYR